MISANHPPPSAVGVWTGDLCCLSLRDIAKNPELGTDAIMDINILQCHHILEIRLISSQVERHSRNKLRCRLCKPILCKEEPMPVQTAIGLFCYKEDAFILAFCS